MYMNHIQNEYVTAANAPYLVQQFPRAGNPPPADYTFHLSAKLQALFDRVRKSRPGWRLKTDYAYALHSGQAVRKVTVWSGDNLLGTVWLDQVYRRNLGMGDTYCYTNERVDRELARKRHKQTTKMEVAAKDIIKNFYEDTFIERMNKLGPRARSMVIESLGAAEKPYRDISSSISALATRYAFDNWDTFVEANPTVDRDAQEKRRAYDAAMKARNGSPLYVHQLPDGMWVKGEAKRIDVYPTFSEITVTDPRQFLSEEQFLSLTMLRLQDTNRFVEGHGVKVDDTTFALVS